MKSITPEDLKKAYKAEKDPRIKVRMAAVNMVCMRGKSIREAADDLMQCPNWVSAWIRRFEEDGLEGLRDLPRPGRSPKVLPREILGIVSRRNSSSMATTPKVLREDIRKTLGVRYHITSVRRILRSLGMSAKTSQRIHRNKASLWKIRRWQKETKERISCLKSRGFLTVIQDESIFVHDPATGKKYWSPKGRPVVLPYCGDHRRVIVCGTIAADGSRFFRTYRRKFDKHDFLSYLKALQRRFGRVHVILDKSSVHNANIVREHVSLDENVEFTFLPTATPELSAIEEYWHQSKRDILVSEYYATFEHMRRTLSEYLRTYQTSLDVMRYISRRSLTLKNL